FIFRRLSSNSRREYWLISHKETMKAGSSEMQEFESLLSKAAQKLVVVDEFVICYLSASVANRRFQLTDKSKILLMKSRRPPSGPAGF
ncbi:MAG TPA: hypothetical protein VK255_00855, partial [Patescibacteria group bacterium]|nr:hypothetical protein [Patescibacteria group bacterium]